jgi:hypothetical protein
MRAEARTRNTQTTNVNYAAEIASRISTAPSPAHNAVAAMQQRRHEALQAHGAFHLSGSQPRLAPGPYLDPTYAGIMASPATEPLYSGHSYSNSDRAYNGYAYKGQGYNVTSYGAAASDRESPYRSGESSQHTSPIAAPGWSPAHATGYPYSFYNTPFQSSVAPSPSLAGGSNAVVGDHWSSTITRDEPKAYGQHRPSDASQTSSVPTLASDTTRPTTATTAVESPSGDYGYLQSSSFAPFDSGYMMGPSCQRDY